MKPLYLFLFFTLLLTSCGGGYYSHIPRTRTTVSHTIKQPVKAAKDTISYKLIPPNLGLDSKTNIIPRSITYKVKDSTIKAVKEHKALNDLIPKDSTKKTDQLPWTEEQEKKRKEVSSYLILSTFILTICSILLYNITLLLISDIGIGLALLIFLLTLLIGLLFGSYLVEIKAYQRSIKKSYGKTLFPGLKNKRESVFKRILLYLAMTITIVYTFLSNYTLLIEMGANVYSAFSLLIIWWMPAAILLLSIIISELRQ